MDLETLAQLSQIAGGLTLVGGAIFGSMQLLEIRRQRSGQVAADVMRTFMIPELTDAIALLRKLPDGVSAEELRRHGPEAEKAAILVCMMFETLGLLVYQRIAPLSLVLELAGGITCVMWRKLGPWMEQIRIEQSQPSWAEWFQWLAAQCERHKRWNEPAHVRYVHWEP